MAGPRWSHPGSPDNPDNPENDGWHCSELGDFVQLMPNRIAHHPRFRAGMGRALRDVLLRDTAHRARERRQWVALQTARGTDPDFVMSRDDDSFSFMLAGNTGSGDAGQYAVASALRYAGADTDFMILCGNVVYPDGRLSEYGDRFFRPYHDYPAPIYAIPGEHDWGDGLAGFMRVFCEAGPSGDSEDTGNSGGPPVAPDQPIPYTDAWLRTRFGKSPEDHNEKGFTVDRMMRAAPGQQALQPGPYWCLDTPVLRIVGTDLSAAALDRDQGEWLHRVSAVSKPKILLTGMPIYYDNRYSPRAIEDLGSLDEVVRTPDYQYIAVFSGGIANYQSYPVRVGERIIWYVVAGGGGAPLRGTHSIPRIRVAGVTEEEFHCYPLRSDSRRYFELRGRSAGGLASLIPRAVLRGRIFEPFGAPDGRPPLFRSFLRVDVTPGTLRIRCFAATGCREHELDPPLLHEIVMRLDQTVR